MNIAARYDEQARLDRIDDYTPADELYGPVYEVGSDERARIDADWQDLQEFFHQARHRQTRDLPMVRF